MGDITCYKKVMSARIKTQHLGLLWLWVKWGTEVSFVPRFPLPILGGTGTPHGDVWGQPGCSLAEGSRTMVAVTTVAGRGGLTLAPEYMGTFEDDF